MNIAEIIEDLKLEKLDRHYTATYIDITPNAENPTWALLGIGVTDLSMEYNPNKSSEKWIIYANTNKETDSYDVSTSISQSCYKGDPAFEFLNKIRRGFETGSKCKTHVLNVDTWDAVGEGVSKSYKSDYHDANIAITKWLGENMTLEYDLDYNGNPILGNTTYSNGTPIFTKSADELL